MAITGTASAETGKMYIPHKHEFPRCRAGFNGKPVRTIRATAFARNG